MYDYIIKLCGQQAEVIQNCENEHIRGTDRGHVYEVYCKGRLFSIMLYVRYVHLTKAKHIHNRQTHLLVREDVT
jgi:hypothetical protein